MPQHSSQFAQLSRIDLEKLLLTTQQQLQVSFCAYIRSKILISCLQAEVSRNTIEMDDMQEEFEEERSRLLHQLSQLQHSISPSNPTGS